MMRATQASRPCTAPDEITKAEEHPEMKTLVDHEIEAAIVRGELILDADRANCVGACYELRMGDVYYDLTDGEKRWTVPREGTVLIKPGHRVVLLTHER